jgi:hypothetical protein
MKTYSFLALSIPKPGREAEVEHWYDHQHIPDCLKLDGFVSAQRFRIDEAPIGAAVPAWKIMVIYEITTDDITATMAQIARVVRTPAMPMCDGLDMTTALRLIAEPAAPRFERR